MKYTVEMASDGTIYIPNLMKIDSRIQVIIIMVFPQLFDTLQCW
jgi:hypothetical protein